MREPCFAERADRVLSFPLEGRTATVRAWYGTNTGPQDTGFGAVRRVGNDPRVRGFPVLRAEVEADGRGYENLFGWLQYVLHLAPDGALEDWSPDPLPMFRDRGIPFGSVGYLPTFFDAPFWPERPRLHWVAELFLCPIRVGRPAEEPIDPVLGLRWGFRIREHGGEPERLPLERLGTAAWADARPRLEFWFPGWRFSDAPRLATD